jgi:ubiquinone biosynthesis O-methyltransferase
MKKFREIMQNKGKLKFKNNKELEKYYNNVWHKEGYQGLILFGIDIGKMYHKERQKSVLKSLNLQKKDTVLDAGCGEGFFSIKISKECKKVYGVDIAKTAFQKNNTKKGNVIFKKMNIERLEFPDEFFDKITCVETIEHVLNPDKVLKECHRVLKKDGIFVISYPFINKTLMNKFELIFKKREGLIIPEHLNEWEYDEALDHFKKNGFKVTHSEGIVFDLKPLYILRNMNKFFAISMTKLMLFIKIFPRNSRFVVFVLKKNEE